MKTFSLDAFFQFQFKEIYDFSSRLSRYLSPCARSRSYFSELVHKFSFYDCFFFVNEFDIHKFVIYYANGHLNYLSRERSQREKRFSGLIMMIILKICNQGMRFHANKLFCIVFPAWAKQN